MGFSIEVALIDMRDNARNAVSSLKALESMCDADVGLRAEITFQKAMEAGLQSVRSYCEGILGHAEEQVKNREEEKPESSEDPE